MPALFAEIEPGQGQAVVHELAARRIDLVRGYPNISKFLGQFQKPSQIALFEAPPNTLIPPLIAIPGIRYLEPDEEHTYAQQPLWWRTEPFGTPFMALPPLLPLSAARQSSIPHLMQMSGFPEALNRSNGGQGSVLVIVDSGVDGSRVPAARRAGGWAAAKDNPWIDQFGHGTMTALIAMEMAPNAKVFSGKMPPGGNGGILKRWVMAAIEDMLPIIIANPDLRFVMNNSWASGCGKEPYH